MYSSSFFLCLHTGYKVLFQAGLAVLDVCSGMYTQFTDISTCTCACVHVCVYEKVIWYKQRKYGHYLP